MKNNTKEWIQYGTAIALIVSAITIAFVSFLITFKIGAGVLAYIGESFASAMGIFGIGIYFSNQLTNFKTEIRNEIKDTDNKTTKQTNK